MGKKKEAGGQGFRDWALDGIFLRAPEAWQPLRVGGRFLSLGHAQGPSLVLTWASGPARLDGKKALALARKAAKGASLSAWSLPEAWQDALRGREAFGFREKEGGLGVVLCCEQCGGPILAWFSPSPGKAFPEARALALLESIDHHPPGPGIPLRLFDIRARVPEGYSLKSAKFDSGLFMLGFIGEKKALSLCRLAPASLILARTDFKGLAQKLFPELGEPSAAFEDYSPDGAAGCRAAKEEKRLFFRPHYKSLCRLWQPRDRNRIIGAWTRSGNPEPDMEFVCEHYEIT